ncbi:MAG: hypothetical protein JXX14_00785 [Deltaproteobacteria bacterium]|nr:hypothetical protein [Deltaproteobacteria bacterium]
MHLRILFVICFGVTVVACGGTGPRSTDSSAAADGSDEMGNLPPAERLTADDVYRAELIQSELTDEVDEKRYKAIGEVLTEVSPRQRIIYFVGKLRRVPTQARIQVMWYHDKVAEPMVVNDVHGSDTFSFVSSFTPPGPRFIPGHYTVKVTVNDRVVGTVPFSVKGEDPFSAGLQIKNLQIAKKLNKKTGAPIKPDTTFKIASILHASFVVKNCMSPTDLTAYWYRGESLFSESNISVDGNGRFSANVESQSGLPNGLYRLELEHEGQVMAETKFAVGNASLGPSIDTVEIGEEEGRGGMPKQASNTFRSSIGALYLGLRFLDMPLNSEIQVDWVMVDGESESVYHTVKSVLPHGGSGTMGANWTPGEIYPGNYRAVIYINGERSTDKEFTVQ